MIIEPKYFVMVSSRFTMVYYVDKINRFVHVENWLLATL